MQLASLKSRQLARIIMERTTAPRIAAFMRSMADDLLRVISVRSGSMVNGFGNCSTPFWFMRRYSSLFIARSCWPVLKSVMSSARTVNRPWRSRGA